MKWKIVQICVVELGIILLVFYDISLSHTRNWVCVYISSSSYPYRNLSPQKSLLKIVAKEFIFVLILLLWICFCIAQSEWSYESRCRCEHSSLYSSLHPLEPLYNLFHSTNKFKLVTKWISHPAKIFMSLVYIAISALDLPY